VPLFKPQAGLIERERKYPGNAAALLGQYQLSLGALLPFFVDWTVQQDCYMGVVFELRCLSQIAEARPSLRI
jgi:hypothetical protein